ncbi:MAG: DUF2510 domain-containing protein [Streptomycetaceae bacterium]|nr:DUF2510 domain-containing protein [Streptomycetaceae bacterium]
MVTENRPSGWYKDPSGQPDMLRWWNGTSWTDDFRPQSEFLQSSSVPQSVPTDVPADAPGDIPVAPPPLSPPPFSFRDEPQSAREQAAAQPTVAASAAPDPWPGSDRPIPQPVAPVRFQTVEPNRTRTRLIAGAVALVVAVAAGVGGYLLGQSGDDDDKATASASANTSPSASASAPTDVASPDGFSGTALVGGKTIPGGQQIVGPNQKMTFTIPTGWTPQVDPKATSEEARYVLNPYACTGRTDNACAKALVVHNLRLLSGGWSELNTLTVGMGQELVKVQTNGTKPPGSLNPIKQKAVKLQGLDGYLALWDVPMLAGQTAPGSYCGVLAVKTAADTTEIAVLQMCVDRTGDAPPVSLLDEIANSVKIKT